MPLSRRESMFGRWVFGLALLIFLTVTLGQVPRTLAAPPTDLFFSEYIEGSSNNKALEIYNGKGSAVNLLAGAYSVEVYFNGSTTPGLIIGLTGTVASGDVYVVTNVSASASILAQADQITTATNWYNGDDAVVLRKGPTVIDVIGQVGFDPGTEWGTGLTSTADNTLRRKAGMCAGDPVGSDPFDPAVAWDGFATNTFEDLGAYLSGCGDVPPVVSSTTPVANAGGVALDANITVSFSEPVTVSSTWFDISCTLSGAHTAVVSGGGSSYTLDPDSDFAAGDDCTVTLYGAQIADQDELPQTMAEDYAWSFGAFAICGDPATAIHDIQGSGNASPLVGNYRTIEGVVVGDFQGPTGGASAELNGFFVQEEEAQYDSDSATSEGIFVFEGGSAVNVNVGDVVRVRGPIAEFNFGSGGDAGNANGQTLTQLGTVSSISVCSSANLLPAAYGLDLPVDPAFIYESIEGMYVSTVEDLVATEVFWLGRYGQVLLSSGDRLWQPTNIYPAGPDTDALTLANALNSVYIDDDTNAQNPADNPYLYTLGPDDQTLRIGATTGAFFGVLDYMESFGHNVYALRPVGGIPAFTPGNDRPAAPTFPDADVTVASFNVLNYFNGDGLGGGFPTSRGASTPLEFTRQRDKIITAITALDASVVGLMEIENDAPPYSAIEDLVAGLNAATASGTYAFVDTGVVGTDAIKVGIIYQPADVTPVGNWATITTGTFANRSRPPIAQAFRHEATGEIFVVVVNHFKSKGCDGATGADTDQGDGQSCWNALRVQSAQELAAWLATDPTGTGDSDVLIIGDLNSYLQEDPILALESLGYTNLLEQFIGDHAYTYVFDGRAGVLDHALASPSIAGNVLGIAPWHINADEPSVIDYDMNFKPPSQQNLYTATPYRSSDHDPVLVALDFAAPTHVSFPLVIGHQEFTCDFTDTRSDGCFFRFDYTTPTNKSAWLTDLRVWSDSTRSTLLTGYSLVEEYRGASNHLRQYDVTFRDWQLFGFTIDGGATVPDAPFSFEVYTPVYFEVRLGTGATCDLIRGWYDPVAQTVTILEVTACLP